MAKTKPGSRSSMSKSKQQIPQRPDAERRARQNDRLSRVLRILELIQSRGRYSAKDLARACDCSERTVYRHLEALALAGVPWYFDDHGKCYRVRDGYRFPAVNLSADELLDQAVASQIATAPGLNIGAGAKKTTERLAISAREDHARLLEEAQHLIRVLGIKLADHSQHGEMLKTIQWALVKRQQLNTTYHSPYQQRPVKLVLHPYRLCLAGQAWYLVAQAADSDRPKTYRVQRFQSVRPSDRASTLPDDFDLASYFGNAWNVYRGQQSYNVEIEFSPESAAMVTETQWHHTQQVKARHKDGRVVLAFTVDGLDEIVWWLLGWSAGAKVLQPEPLRQLLVERLQSALRLNSS